MSAANGDDGSVFRRQAIDNYTRDERGDGLLRLSSPWSRWSFTLLMVCFAAGVLYMSFGRIEEYAVGPALIRVEDRTDVTAVFDGTVSTVNVQPGQHVAQGQVLVRFFMEKEQAELARIRTEFDLQLLKELRDPSDQSVRSVLSTLRAQRELASTRLKQQVVRAPSSGAISDVRIRAGEHLNTGDLIVTIIGEHARLSLLALLPGRFRPMLRPGMRLRFELVGYRYRYSDVQIDTIGDEIVGPTEVKRYLGRGLADGIAVDEPVVLVRASLPSDEFRFHGMTFHYFDGLRAQAHVSVRAEPLIFALVPALRGVAVDRGQ